TELHPHSTYENRAETDRRKYPLHTVFLHCRLDRMKTAQCKIGVFQKVGECLYRYSSNGVYYGRIRVDGKEIKQSLKTTDRDLAKRNLNMKFGPVPGPEKHRDETACFWRVPMDNI